MPLEVQENLIDNTQGEQNDVLNKLNEAKQKVGLNESLVNNLDDIIKKANSSSEALSVLNGIVKGITVSGKNLDDNLEKVCYCFRQFEERSESAKASLFGLGDAYNKFGKNAPSQFGKIISSLEEVRTIQNDLSKSVSLPIIGQVSALTKEITKLISINKKGMPSMPSRGISLPVVKQMTTLTKEVRGLANIKRNQKSTVNNDIPVRKFATGGEVPGNSTSGDKVTIRVNSKEVVMTQPQMRKLGKIIGGNRPLSPKQVFQIASGRTNVKGDYKNGMQAFARGGFVTALDSYIRIKTQDINNQPRPTRKADIKKQKTALDRIDRLKNLFQLVSDNDIEYSDISSLITSGFSLDAIDIPEINRLIKEFGSIKKRKISEPINRQNENWRNRINSGGADLNEDETKKYKANRRLSHIMSDSSISHSDAMRLTGDALRQSGKSNLGQLDTNELNDLVKEFSKIKKTKSVTEAINKTSTNTTSGQLKKDYLQQLKDIFSADEMSHIDVEKMTRGIDLNNISNSELQDLLDKARIKLKLTQPRDTNTFAEVPSDSPNARMFQKAAIAMRQMKANAKNPEERNNLASKIREGAAVKKKIERVEEKGNKQHKARVDEILEKHGIKNMEDVIKKTPKELEDINSEINEIEDNVEELDDEFDKITNKMDDTSESLAKMFKQWGVGNILVISGIILVAQKIKEMGKHIQEWLSEIVKLNIEYTRLQQNMNSLGGSINMDAVREELNLTREGAIGVAEACKEIALAGMNSMDNVTLIASNLKNALGQVDISMLKQAVSIIKDLPKEQVNVLLTGTGSFDDKASLLTNLLNDGNLEAAIDLTANGAFGNVNGGIKLSPKDKAIIESQNQANKLLEDIKFGLYDWMPGVVGHAGIIVSTIGTMAANLVSLIGFGFGTHAAVKHLASAAGLGVIHTTNVGIGSSSSWKDMFKNPAAIGKFAKVLGKTLVWSLIPLAASWGLDKIASSYKNEYESKKIRESGINRARYGTSDGDLSEADKYKRGGNTWGDAGTGAAILGGAMTVILGGLALIGTGVGVIPGALLVLGATIVGAVAGAIWGFNKDVNSLFEGKNALDKNYYQKSLKESEKAAKFLNDLKENDSLEQVVKKQLNEMIQLNKYNKKIQSILSGRRYAYQRQDIQAGLDYMETNSMTGGSDNEYNRIFEDVTRKRIDLIKKESQAMSDTTANSLKNTQSDSTKTVIFNDFLSKQKQFIAQVDEEFSKILNSLYKAPGIIKRKLQNEISNLKIELGNQFFMTYDNSEHRKSYGNSAQNIQKYNEQFEKFTKQAETIKLAFKSVRDAADNEMKKTGIKSDKQAQDIVDKGVKDLNEIIPHLGDLKYVMDTFTEYGNVNSNEDALAKLPLLKASAADATKLAREMGDNELADELGKVEHQLGDVQKILADPKSTEEEKKAALERYKKLTAFVVQMFNKHYQKPLADFKRKNPKYEDAKKYQAAKRVKTSATTAENMVLQQNKNALEEVVGQINKEVDNMRKQIELAFDHGSAVFARTLSNNIEKQKEYDSLANSTTASRASVEASDLVLQNLETSLARANDVVRESEGKPQEYYNEYRKKLMSSDAGREKLKEQEKNGVAEYQRQLIKETELRRRLLTEKSKKERAKLTAQLRNNEEKRKGMEQKKEVRDWMKSSEGDTFMRKFGSIIGPLDAMIKKQSEYKDEYLRQMKIIADVVSNALNDGVVKLSETIMEAASARANFHKTYGNYGKSVSDARDSIKDSMITKEEGIKKINESFEIAREKSMKMYAEAMKETDPEKRRTKLASAGITMAQAEKNRIEAMEKLYKDMTDRISDYINIKTEKLGRIEESIDIEKDFANQIGAPFEYIVELEKASVQMAREKVRLAEEELKFIEEAGIKGEVREKAKLKLQKAQAEELKATFGAQRDSIDKMLGKVMGTFQEIGGIFGPNSERMMAKKYGQGYMMNEAGLAVRAGEWTHGFADRTRHAGLGVPTFSSGGKVEKHGKFNFIKQLISLMTGGKGIPFISNGEIPGNSIVGDNMLIRVNSKENVVTKKQMDNIQDLLGLSSHNEVFAAANNPQLLAIRGMDDLQNYIGKSFNSKLPTDYISDIEKIYGQLSNFSNNGNNEITQQPSIDNGIEELQKQLLSILPTFANGGPLDKDKSFIAASLLNRKYNHSKVNLSKYFDRQGNFIVSSARKYGMTDNNQYKGALDMSISDALKFKSGTRFQEDVYDPDEEKRIAELHNKKLQAIIDGDVLDATPGALKPIGAGGNNGGNNRGLVPMAFANNGNTVTSSNTAPTAANTLYSINQQSKKPSKNQVLRSFDNSFFGKMGNMNPGETKNPEADKLTKISSDVEKILKILNENTETVTTATDRTKQELQGAKSNTQILGKKQSAPDKVKQAEEVLRQAEKSGASADVIQKAKQELQNAKASQTANQGNVKSSFPSSVFDMPNLYTPEGGVNPDVVMSYIERITSKSPVPELKSDTSVEGKTAGNSEESSAKGALSEEGGKSIRDIENERALAKALKNPCKTKASSIEIQKDILDVAREIRDLLRNGNNSSTGTPKKSDEAPGKPDMSMPEKPDSELPEKPTTRKVPNIPKASMDPTNTAIAAAGILLAGTKLPTAKTTLPASQTPKPPPQSKPNQSSPKTPGKNPVPGADKAKGTAGKSVNPFRLDPNNAHTGHIVLSDKEREFVEAIKNSRLGKQVSSTASWLKGKLPEWGKQAYTAAGNLIPKPVKNAAHWIGENAPKAIPLAKAKLSELGNGIVGAAKNHAPDWMKNAAHWTSENAPKLADWARNHSPEWLKKTADWVGKNAPKAKSLAAKGGRWIKGGGGLRLAGRGLQAYATLMDAKEALGHASNTYNNWSKMSASERTEGIFDTASSVAKGTLNWAPLPLALLGRGTLGLGEYARDLIHETDAHSENAVGSSADVIRKGAKLTKTKLANRSQSGNFRAFNPDGTATNKDDWERMIKADIARQQKQYKHILHQTGKGGFGLENAKNVAMAKASATGVWDKMTGGSQAKAAKQVALDTVQVKREDRAYQLSKLLDLGTYGGGGFNEEDTKMVSDILPQMQSGKRYNYEFARLKKKAIAGSVKTHTGIMEQQNKNAAKLSPDVVFSKENIEEVRRSFPNTEQGRHDLQRFDDIIEERKKMWMAAAAQDQALADQQKDLIGKMKKPGENPEMIARELKDISERRKLIQDSMSKSIPDQWGKKQDQSGQKPGDKNKPEGKNKPGERQVTDVLLPLSARQKNGSEQQPVPDDKQTQSVAAKITDTVTSTMKNAMDSMPNLLQMSGFGQKYQGMLEGDLMSAQMKSIFEQNQSQQYAGSNPNSPKNALGLGYLDQEYASSPTRKKQPFNNFDPNNPFKSNAKDPFAGFDPQNPFTKASSTSINRETVAIMQRLGAANKNLLGNVANQNTPESPNAVPTSALNKEQKIEVVFSLKGDELKKMLQYYVNNNSSAIVKNGLYKS